MKTTIVIPARFGSKRFPGKPLAKLEGKAILQRVWEIAETVCAKVPDCDTVVATETPDLENRSERIVEFCESRRIPVVVTPSSCRSGSDRAWAAVSYREETPDVVVNLQGDNPICPPQFVVDLIEALRDNINADVATIYTRLNWEALDALRDAKKTSPFSGTTVAVAKTGDALWFSKNIIPAIRGEEALRAASPISPICRHIGLYAYRFDALRFFANSKKGEYEKLEQLEQLRFIENGYKIQMIEGAYPTGFEGVTSGVDTLEDLERVAAVLRTRGELLDR